MAERMRAFDWADTPVGPVDRWPQSLRTAVGICLSSRHPMVIWWGPQLALLYNDAWVPILGPSKHPALGKPGASVWPEMWHIIGEQMRSVLATGEATWSDDQLLPAMRFGYLEEAYFTYSYSAIHDENGAVAGVFTAVTETTSRVLSERRLRILRELGEVSAVTAPSVDQACAAALEVLSRNRAALPFALIYLIGEDGHRARLEGSYGVASGPAASEIAPLTVPRADSEGFVWHLVGSGRSRVATGLSRRYPGALLPGVTEVGDRDPDTAVVLPLAAAGLDHPAGILVVGISPFRALDPDYRGFCDLVAGHVAAAVADARAYEAERRRAEALAELDRAKTEFFSNISHEFRTPLTLIMGPLAELRAAPELEPHARLREELEVIHRNGLRLGKLVNTLLDFSRIQAGRLQACYEPLDLAMLTAELASVFRSAIERAGLKFVVDCLDLGQPVYADREMWEKIVLNLLSNALKFTFDGQITVRTRRGHGVALVTVSDTGTGVPAEELPRLFDRFHRVRGARSRSQEGSGIGLALVAELVALHGGTITVDSAPDVGTTFTVALPMGSAHLPADQIVPAGAGTATTEAAQPFLEEALRWLPSAAETMDTPDALGLVTAERPGPIQGRVLVADDNADMRAYLQRLLGSRYDVQAVSDGVAALAAARAHPPDLILSDVMMPGMDGLELVRALRGQASTARVPVLLLSARAGQEAAIEGLAAGADDYLLKPFSAGELLARVGAHLQLGRVRREAEQRFQVMADLAPTLIWVTDDSGARVFANHGWQIFTGADPAAQLGTDWQAGVHPEDVSAYQLAVARARNARQPWQLEYRLRHAAGDYRWVLEHAVPIGEGDRFSGYVGSVVDIHTRYRETERQTLLAELAAALDAETGAVPRMAQLVRHMVKRRVADGCTVIRVGAGGQLHRMVLAAIDDDTAAALAAASPDLTAACKVRDNGRSLLITDADPDLDQLWRSVISVALTARGQLLGLLFAGRRAESPRFDADDCALLEDIGAQAGVALDNAVLLAEERATAARLELLQQAAAALSAAATPAAVAHTAISHFSQLLGADAAAVYELRETRTLELVAMRGWGEGVDRDWQTMPIDGVDTPTVDAARRCQPVWLESLADWQRAYPALVPVMIDIGFRATVNLPLLVDNRCIGTVAIGFLTDRALTPAEQQVAMSLADHCAQALHRAQLLAAETAARVAAERFNRLVGALSSATGMAEVVQIILDYARELGARAAVVLWREPNDQLTVLASNGFPEPTARLSLDAAHPLAHAIRTAEPVWSESRSSVAWQNRASDLDGPLPVQVAVPLIVDDIAIGALGLRFAGAAPRLGPDERAMMLALCGQCGQALDRARLYQAEHDIAQTLQHSLLPQQLPELDRLALAACYLPGAPGVAAGGDWYDVLELDGQRVAIVVGDVVGKGAAAAAVMGQLRTALATALLHGDSPATALEHLDRVAARIPGALASTAAAVILDLATGELRWARAGHPPPVLLTRHETRYLFDGAGGPLGISRRPPYAEAGTRIEPGASLLLYTDGLIERRGQAIDDGLDHLASTATQLHGHPPHSLVTQLLARALPDAGPADDIALIVARYLPAPLHQRLPADPAELRGLRRSVHAWADTAALGEQFLEDLQLALGEAAANAAEHAYPSSPGEFTCRITRLSDGCLEVEVRDFGRWRPPAAGSSHRGRGLAMIQELATNVVVDPSSTGTRVCFCLPAEPADSKPPAAGRQLPTHPVMPTPAVMQVHPESDAGRRLEFRGELDLAATTTLHDALLQQLSTPGPVILDLRGVDYLSSAGVGLLIDASRHAAAHGCSVALRLAPQSLPARVLALTGLPEIMPVIMDSTMNSDSSPPGVT
jgi:anti-anti-sigma factor